MKQRMKIVVTALAGLAALAVWVPAAPAADAQMESYVVRPGDTLSGIAGRVLGDPQRWREIHSVNPQVTNPNRIYPGDTLAVPASPTAAASSSEAAPGGLYVLEVGAPTEVTVTEEQAAPVTTTTVTVEVQEAAPAAAEPAPEPVAPVRVVHPATYRNAGFIVDGLPTIAIIASETGKIANGTDDVVIVNAQAPVGARYTVVRADRRIFHPRSGMPMGWLIQSLGTAEVICTGENTSMVMLHGMRDAATVGDYLLPEQECAEATGVIPPKTQKHCLASGPEDAMIVAFDEDRAVGGELDIAYIDRGTSSGVDAGKRYVIYRELQPGGPLMIGELQVIRAGATTASVLITNNLEEIQVADLLRAQ